jgi:Esterase PHB depolymerase
LRYGVCVYPEDCEQGRPCRVHIALHGCKQDIDEVGLRFVESTGYNAWADNNRLMVLYPQTRSISPVPYNPLACWDWWSYVDHSDGYITKSGAQIRTIKAMLDALTSGAKPAPESRPAGPPTLAVIDTSDTGADLAWTAPAKPARFRISRAGTDGQFVVIGETTGSSFADTGLAPQSTYHWHVAVIVNNVEGPGSADVSAATRARPAPCHSPGRCPIAR